MNIREKIFLYGMLATCMMWCAAGTAKGQIDIKQDTLECHIVGFNVGPVFASSAFSFATAPDGSRSTEATMESLYKSPYLDFGLDGIYKYKSGWLVTLDANLWFGSNNLRDRFARMGSIYTRDSVIIGRGGMDAVVTCYNRGFSIQGGGGKIIPLSPLHNPNSGLMLRVAGGYMLQQTIFMVNDQHAPQIEGDQALLYDHQRQGVMLTESLGYWFMSNKSNLANLYIAFELSQCWSWSTRDYIIDYKLGLQGKDNNRYFDLMYSIKLCWMFPLRGKVVHDYYFY